MQSTVSLLDWILTVALVAAVWQMCVVSQLQSPDTGNHDLAGSLGTPSGTAFAGPLGRKLQLVRQAGGYRDFEDFACGAGLAYEAILTAFAAGDTGPVAAMLDPEVREALDDAIMERRDKGQTLTLVFIGLSSAEPIDAGLDEGRCWVKMRLVAQMVAATADIEGNLLTGHPSRVDEIADVWTFARDPHSRDPNWMVVATGGEG